jgi:hypothetical protein
MELKKTQVDIEVIQNQDKKYFGLFGTKPAVVRMIKKSLINNSGSEDQTIEQDVPILQLDLDQDPYKSLNQGKNKTVSELGKVWVKGGEIFYKETPNHYPTITPPIGVFLYKNEELISNTTALMEKDLLVFDFQNDFKDLSWSISLDSLNVVALFLYVLHYLCQ